jgi:hypothetical protein
MESNLWHQAGGPGKPGNRENWENDRLQPMGERPVITGYRKTAS